MVMGLLTSVAQIGIVLFLSYVVVLLLFLYSIVESWRIMKPCVRLLTTLSLMIPYHINSSLYCQHMLCTVIAILLQLTVYLIIISTCHIAIRHRIYV